MKQVLIHGKDTMIPNSYHGMRHRRLATICSKYLTYGAIIHLPFPETVSTFYPYPYNSTNSSNQLQNIRFGKKKYIISIILTFWLFLSITNAKILSVCRHPSQRVNIGKISSTHFIIYIIILTSVLRAIRAKMKMYTVGQQSLDGF